MEKISIKITLYIISLLIAIGLWVVLPTALFAILALVMFVLPIFLLGADVKVNIKDNKMEDK